MKLSHWRDKMHLLGYEARLNLLVDAIFAESDDLDMSVSQMAKDSGLAYTTVANIERRKTLLPRFRTVLALARSVGMDLDLVKVAKQAAKGKSKGA